MDNTSQNLERIEKTIPWFQKSRVSYLENILQIYFWNIEHTSQNPERIEKTILFQNSRVRYLENILQIYSWNIEHISHNRKRIEKTILLLLFLLNKTRMILISTECRKCRNICYSRKRQVGRISWKIRGGRQKRGGGVALVKVYILVPRDYLMRWRTNVSCCC